MICLKKMLLANFILLVLSILSIECLPQSKGNQFLPGYSEYDYLNEPKKRMLNGLRFQELLRLQKLKDSAKFLEALGKRSTVYGIYPIDDEYY
ncbi:hypothetical protein KSF78_0006326 [Schistosoma japonicum]|uniref:Hypotheticial protein n=1 Tax=Schistosoma japonicum TaxID=6182 RepID=C1LGM2_SCHJA|nr:hypothetical protein KSF78_0006326 [Schistosoma japonicum]CAX73849.1 hypotheticial protein [Schistosoma japonicum]CAX73850.1 hypotheticial protein [Schistosoma japonicum]